MNKNTFFMMRYIMMCYYKWGDRMKKNIILLITALFIFTAQQLSAVCVSLVPDDQIGSYKICADPTSNNGICGWPASVTVTKSAGASAHAWGYMILPSKGDWIQAEYHGNDPVAIAMTELSFWPDSGCARVLVDGVEVWSGDLDVASYAEGAWKWVKVAGLGPGHHTIKVENNTSDSRPWKSISVGKFGFNYLDNDEDGDGVDDAQDPCPDSKLAPPFTVMQVDKYGCTPNQNLSELLNEYLSLNLTGRPTFGTSNLWNGATANLRWNFNSWGPDQDITGKGHYLGSIYIDRDTEGGIACEHYQISVVCWLYEMHKCKKVIDPAANPNRTYADLFNGLDFVPVKSWAPTAALGHKAAAVYFSGLDWKKGMVLDPWVTQHNAYYSASVWADTMFYYGKPDDAERWQGDFPLTGGTGYNYSPQEAPGWMDNVIDQYNKFKIGGLLDCQVDLQVTDKATGKRAGMFSSQFINEIPGAYLTALCTGNNTDNKAWSFFLPDGSFDITIKGKASDRFRLKVAHPGQGVYDYGSQSITSGNNATVTLTPSSPANKMTLPGGSKVTPALEEVEISLDRASLLFCATTSGYKTGPQTIGISNLKNGLLNWSVSDNASWLSCDPLSGGGYGVVTVSVNPSSLPAGTYTGTITISAADASNSPQTVPVTLKVYGAGATALPFGEFSTPTSGSTVMSSIPVTGWVLDDIGVESVKIYRGETGSLVYIGDALFVEGSRPDVALAYPQYPMNYKAGWGYMMLTNFLPSGGNGTFKIHAIATDSEGHTLTLGTRTITCDNAHAVKPFGAIDTPAQGGVASGSNFINWGWVLTPQPNNIPTNGSTINVFVDGVYLGHPNYNVYREDISSLFPGYANTNGAIGYYFMDTASFQNGIHSIAWSVTDSGGNSDGIGSRYFSVRNAEQNATQSTALLSDIDTGLVLDADSSDLFPGFAPASVKVKKGFDDNIETIDAYPDKDGTIRIESEELDRIVIDINFNTSDNLEGYLILGNRLKPLPIGSSLDRTKGIFYWQPGPGFIGRYRFVFIGKDDTGRLTRKNIIIDIKPKGN
jgi:hypothetical protein